MDAAAYAMGFLAAEYVALPEVWPMFTTFIGTRSDLPILFDADMMPELIWTLARKMRNS